MPLKPLVVKYLQQVHVITRSADLLVIIKELRNEVNALKNKVNINANIKYWMAHQSNLTDKL